MYCQMCKDITGCNFCGGQRRKPNKNKIKSTPTQSPVPTGPKGSKGPTGPRGHKGPKVHAGPKGPKGHTSTGPNGPADPTRKQRDSPIPSPYQNSPLVPGPEWNTTGIEDSNRTTVDHDLNFEVKKVIYLETAN